MFSLPLWLLTKWDWQKKVYCVAQVLSGVYIAMLRRQKNKKRGTVHPCFFFPLFVVKAANNACRTTQHEVIPFATITIRCDSTQNTLFAPTILFLHKANKPKNKTPPPPTPFLFPILKGKLQLSFFPSFLFFLFLVLSFFASWSSPPVYILTICCYNPINK